MGTDTQTYRKEGQVRKDRGRDGSDYLQDEELQELSATMRSKDRSMG